MVNTMSAEQEDKQAQADGWLPAAPYPYRNRKDAEERMTERKSDDSLAYLTDGGTLHVLRHSSLEYRIRKVGNLYRVEGRIPQEALRTEKTNHEYQNT